MKSIKKNILKVFGNEKYQSITIPLLVITLGLIFGFIIMLLLGKNPLAAYQSLLQGVGILPKENYAASKGMLSDFFSFLDYLTPLIFASLAVAIAMKAGIFNIGISGQMLFSSFIATVLIGYSDLPSLIAKPLVLIIGMIAGASIGALIGYLKHRFNVNVVVACIMINYIIQYIISFLINTNYLNPISRQSNDISQASRLTLKNVTLFNLKVDLPLAFIIAIIVVFIIKFLLNKTIFGFEMKAVGLSEKSATYAGMSIKANVMKTMILSGALSGLAGVSYYLGFLSSIQPRSLPEMGFNSIAVSLLGNNNPVGIIFSSFFISILSKGSTYMSSSVGVDAEIASLITAVILVFSACTLYIKHRIQVLKVNNKGGIQ